MKKKSKIFSLIGVLLVFTLVLTACGAGKEEKKVAKLVSVGSEEETSGEVVSVINPEAEELEEEIDVEKNEEEKEDGSSSATATGSKNLTVATFNIANGRDANYDYSIIAADISKSGADIVALQEVDQVTLRNGSQDTMEILAAETGMSHYAFAPAISPYQEGEYGVAVLSKYPIESYMYFELPKVNAKEEQRVLLHAEINVNGTMLDFFVTHSQNTSVTKQLATANEHTSSCSKFIFAGDFNTSNYSYFQAIANSYTIIGSANPILTSASYSYDNMVISNNIQSSNVRTYNTGHSDHYMLLANVVIPAGN